MVVTWLLREQYPGNVQRGYVMAYMNINQHTQDEGQIYMSRVMLTI